LKHRYRSSHINKLKNSTNYSYLDKYYLKDPTIQWSFFSKNQKHFIKKIFKNKKKGDQ